MTKSPIDAGNAALRDLYGLIPEKDRKWADDNMRILEHVLHGYARALDFQREMATKLAWATKDQTLTEERIKELS